MDKLIAWFGDQYHATSNPNGIINFATAENNLTFERLIAPRLPEIYSASVRLPGINGYQQPTGMPELRAAVASLLSKYVTMCAVDPEHLICQSGTSSILNTLLWVLCDEGDSVLIPAPYYSAFTTDLTAVARVRIVPVRTTWYDEGSTPSSLLFELKAQELQVCHCIVRSNGLLTAFNRHSHICALMALVSGSLCRGSTVPSATRWSRCRTSHYQSFQPTGHMHARSRTQTSDHLQQRPWDAPRLGSNSHMLVSLMPLIT